jgi:hypothetical protein
MYPTIKEDISFMGKMQGSQFKNSILAILAGIAATAATGFILYPLEMLVWDNFFELNFADEPDKYSYKDLILHSSILLWFFLACFAGGLVCSLISKIREYQKTWVLCSITILLLVGSVTCDGYKILFTDLVLLILSCISISIAFVIGTRIGIHIKKKRKT